VPEPDGLLVFARASSPREALKAVGGWIQTPAPGANEVGALVAGEPLGPIVDLDQPLDFVLTLRGREPHGAISAAVRSMDEAKAALAKFTLVPGENGAFEIQGLGKPAGDGDGDVEAGNARVCELIPSFGAAATRLVCAETKGALRELAPWMARTAPRTTFPADVHVELRFAPIRPVAAQMRRLLPMLVGSALGGRLRGSPEADEIFRATVDDAIDFTSDAEDIDLDARLGESQAELTVTSHLRSSTSLLARLAVAHPERAGAPPASFWKLPGDADLAYFHRGLDAADIERARDHVADMVAGALGHEGLADADRKALREAASHTLDLLAAPSSYAKGLDAEGAAKAIAALRAAPSGDEGAREEARRVAAEKMAGWFVVGVDAPAATVAATEKEWVAAWSRPGVAAWRKAKAGDSAPPVVRLAPLPKGVPATSHLEVVVARGHASSDGKKGAKPPPPGKPTVMHALVVPDDRASWIVFAADLDLAVAKAKELLAAGSAPPLEGRAGLSPMKDARMNAGGFVTPRAFAVGDVFSWALSPDRWKGLDADPLGALASAPDQGTIPIPFELASQPGGGASPTGTFTTTVTVPKGAIDALVKMTMGR
jgi:hypothetical protein